MAAELLIRVDDVCPTMAWPIWDRLETVFAERSIRPLLAIVPDNQDPQLDVHPARSDFWHRARAWQAAGYGIGLHGWQHRYVTEEAGLVGLNDYSEFAGLGYAEQVRKLESGLDIFGQEGLQADAFVAPAHSFDDATLRALRHVGLTTISDGFFFWPHRDRSGLFWIPQQLWRVRRPPAGVWTVALHINDWTHDDLAAFTRALDSSLSAIRSLRQIQERWGTRRALGAHRLVSRVARETLRFRRRSA